MYTFLHKKAITSKLNNENTKNSENKHIMKNTDIIPYVHFSKAELNPRWRCYMKHCLCIRANIREISEPLELVFS